MGDRVVSGRAAGSSRRPAVSFPYRHSAGAAHHDSRDPLSVSGSSCWRPRARVAAADAAIPKPEHPRPDAVRPHWANLNGRWQFRFDAKDKGLRDGWEKPDAQGLRPHDRRPVPVGERAVRHPPDRRAPRRSAGIAAVSPSPRTFPPIIASGSGSARSTGAPTSGSTAGRSPSTRGVTRRSRPTSPTP